MHATQRLLQNHRAGGEPLRVLAASGQLGYGIPAEAFARGMARQPHVIGADMGSIDPGPYYLGSGQMAAPPDMVRRDLRLVLEAALGAGVPLVIGSAGTAGARPHLEATAALVREVARELGRPLRLTTIASDVPADTVLQALRDGRLQPIGPMPPPDEAALRGCTHIVGQCGTETLVHALDTDPDVLLVGRACDTAIFAAFPQRLGYPAGLALHMAKIIECTSLCCRPGGRDAMLATLDRDGFTLESMNPDCHATPASVAAHALYEQADPFEVEEPDGTLDLREARYEALDEHRTRVSGARFTPRARPTLKIEGAARVGARALLIAGVADPTLIARLPEVLDAVTHKVRALLPGGWQVLPHVYGQGAVRPLPPALRGSHEAGLVIEFIAPDAGLARTAAAVFKQNLLHHGYPGRLTTAGNLAFAFTPSEVDAHDSFRFVLYHVMADAPLQNLFPVTCQDLSGTTLH
ncbi:acyclic terpene utilization AtuA family protein [Hydrogenophaga sp. OTU3427]|uniref:acyclic terpene utilization AtuA family protein n=1 Tax=Hydrogenophaga sp. OTU3427 TaxID=3043856 RepID=UPI00313E6413